MTEDQEVIPEGRAIALRVAEAIKATVADYGEDYERDNRAKPGDVFVRAGKMIRIESTDGRVVTWRESLGDRLATVHLGPWSDEIHRAPVRDFLHPRVGSCARREPGPTTGRKQAIADIRGQDGSRWFWPFVIEVARDKPTEALVQSALEARRAQIGAKRRRQPRRIRLRK